MNQSGRQEKVRGVLRHAPTMVVASAMVDAALAEVEEWEAERQRSAHIVRAWDVGEARLQAAEAEADRLKAAPTDVDEVTRRLNRNRQNGDLLSVEEVRAALAPADRNTT